MDKGTIKNEDNFLKIIREAKKARMAYEAKMAALRDEKTRLIEAKEEGRMEGRNEGIEIGIQKGKRLTAEKMLRKGLDVETVAELTDLSIKEVEEIKRDMLH
ncbi:hypothetical protein [Caloramator sp. ALD01]|uniref:hypothetical protein n=1 Tax=Caloramator sp. ALD01 TaxID=1031288 RepID=UPI000420C871|nr:hypothetical protein [Caloramator sp. ALD01]